MNIITRIDKLEEKFRERPLRKDLTFRELQVLLTHYGCVFYHDSGGSHYTISTPSRKYPTTFSNHGILKSYQIKLAIEILDELKSEA